MKDIHLSARNGVAVEVDKLIDFVKSRDTQSVSIKDLNHNLSLPCWDEIKTPMELIKEIKRIENVTPFYPIIVDSETKIIYDGMHRYVKAYIRNGEKGSIRVKYVTKEEFNKLSSTNTA